MSPKVKAAVVIGAVVLIAIAVAKNNDTNTVGDSEASAGSAHFVVVKGRCVADPANAYIYVDVTVRNDGDAEGTFTGTPWRRYNDGSVNDSVMDAVMIDIPAGATRKILERYNYDALDHQLLECAISGGSDELRTPLDVL